MAALDTYIVNVALPTIAHYFNVDTSDVALVTICYLLIITSTLPIFGKIGDRTGFKLIFILGFATFTLGSFLSGFAPGIYLLVGARTIQGIGASMLYAVGMAMITRYIPASSRGWAFGITSTMAGLGVVVGAPLGGVITQYLNWNWIFWINVPVGIAAIIVALKVLPHEKREPGGEKLPFDTAGAVMIFLGLVSLVFALNRGQKIGWAHWGILCAFILAALLLAGFVLWERKFKDPLIHPRLFKHPSFTFGSLACMLIWGTFAGGNFLLPFYLSLVRQLQTSLIGAAFLISSIIFIIVSPLMGRLSDRTGPRVLACAGAAGGAAALLFFSFTLQVDSTIPTLVYLALIGLSMGSFVPTNNSVTLGSVPADNQGAASAASRAFQNLGMVLGVAIYQTVFSSVLPVSSMNTSPSGTGLPTDLLLTGFQYAFLAGVAMCAGGFIFSLFAREDRSAGPRGEPPPGML